MTDEMSFESEVRQLEEVLEKARMNSNLRDTVKETLSALRRGDLHLAYELSSVKSLVVGSLDAPARYHFRENADYNRGVLGRDVYGILDTIHHNIAFRVGQIPSGMAVVTLQGYKTKGKPVRSHPLVRTMERERAAIRRR